MHLLTEKRYDGGINNNTIEMTSGFIDRNFFIVQFCFVLTIRILNMQNFKLSNNTFIPCNYVGIVILSKFFDLGTNNKYVRNLITFYIQFY